MDVLPTDATSPSVSILLIVHSFNGDKLSFDKGNYHQWASSMQTCLQSNHLYGYITGKAVRPGPNEPRAQDNWDQNNAAVAAFIANNVCPSEQKFADFTRGAKACWDALAERYTGDDPHRQALLFLQAMSLQASPGTNLLVLLETMQDILTRAFQMGAVTEDTYHIVVFLFILGDCFAGVRSMITRDMQLASLDKPYGMSDLKRYVAMEQFYLEKDGSVSSSSSSGTLVSGQCSNCKSCSCSTVVSQPASPASTPIALVSQSESSSTPSKPSPILLSQPPPQPTAKLPRQKCSNCKRMVHEVQYCISANGGMAGQSIRES